jgi:hypothetical protein
MVSLLVFVWVEPHGHRRRLRDRYPLACAGGPGVIADYLLDQMHLSSPRTENRYRDYLWAATRDIVEREWATIAALAAELH